MKEEILLEFIVFSDGYCVHAELYKRLLEIVRDAAATMPIGCARTAEELCGKDVWSGFARGDRITAGRCVANAVERQLVDLDFAVCPFAHPKRYVRRGDTTARFAKCSRFPS